MRVGHSSYRELTWPFSCRGGGELFLRKDVTRRGTRLFVKQGITLRGEEVDAATLYITGSGFNAAVSDVLVKDLTLVSDNPSARLLFHAIAAGGAKNWRFENAKLKDIRIKMDRLGATLPDGSTLHPVEHLEGQPGWGYNTSPGNDSADVWMT